MTTIPAFPFHDDAADRAAIRERLDATFFVEAGAGAGKTSALVGRVLALVTADEPSGVRLRNIAAITFTEKAASELRDRIRVELERTIAGPASDVERARCRTALDDLDGAAIGTLHAFAQRILTEHPFEAGLPPNVDVLDEISSTVEFDARFTDFQDRLLADDTIERPLLLALSGGIRVSDLRDIAVAFGNNWDLLAARVPLDAPEPPELAVDALVAECRGLEATIADCRFPEDDTLAVQMTGLIEWAEHELAAAPDELEVLRILELRPRFHKGRKGKKDSWPDVEAARAHFGAVHDALGAARHSVIAAATSRIAAEIARFTLTAADERRRGGRLEFHDLLVMARDLLRDPLRGEGVRRRLHARYARLLLDEFQDTDPIQADLAALIASSDPAAGAVPWTDVRVDPGHLFVVGDPKQSIYRFRRADIATFLAARESLGAEPLALTRSFRSTPRVVDFVNHVFAQLIVAEPESQPAYQPLVAARTDTPTGAGVTLMGLDEHEHVTASELRELEASDVADAVLTALGWEVADRRGDDVSHRATRLGDIAILLPARTSLPQLEHELDRRSIPYRAETSSLVYGTREVRDLMAALRSVADSTDQLSLVTALRSPLFGCGDDDLFTFHVQHGGRWNHQAPLPDTLPPDHPVGEAITYLASLHADRLWEPASALLDRIVRDRRVLELGFARGRPRDLWRRVRFVIDQARSYAESEGGALPEYLEWAALQSSEGARVMETILPETDDDAVRILTVHGAKGLEFPVVILSGMSTAANRRMSRVEVRFPRDGTFAMRVGKEYESEEFERYKPIDEQMDFHEKLRLLYVAATRACDHLVVSVHRKARAKPVEIEKMSHAEMIWGAAHEHPDLWDDLRHELPAAAGGRAAIERTPVEALGDRDEWLAARDDALRRAAVRRVMSATGVAASSTEHDTDYPSTHQLDPGLRKEPVDLELPPWQRGRYGTSIGRAVHAVLQTVALSDGAGIDDAARAQAAAEGVIGHEERIVALARAAIASDVVQEAVSGQHWRETYVGSPVDVSLIEGYVDLIYRSPAGLVVVDYKTDAWTSEVDLDAKLERYRLQGATYALAVQQATGETVVRCVFLFLGSEQAVAREIAGADLEAAMADVRSAVTPAR